MAEFPKPLEHQDADKKDDETLRQEAQAYLAKSPALQVIAELIHTLRATAPSWWTPQALRVAHPATTRIAWLRQRPDLRQQVTTAITGLTPKIARRKAPEFQSALIDAALDDGDVAHSVFEEAFEPRDLAVYGAADDLWRTFRKRMPWNENTPVLQELVGTLMKVLLADKSELDGLTRKPIVSAWDVRTSIPSLIWHARMPADIIAAIDDARFKKEKSNPREVVHAAHDLAIAKPEIIAKHILLKDLESIFDSAEKLMGIGPAEAKAPVEAKPVEAKPAAEKEAKEAKPVAASAKPVVSAAAAVSPAPPPAVIANATVTAATTVIPNAPPAAPSVEPMRAQSKSAPMMPTPFPAPSEWGPEPSTSGGGAKSDGSVDLMVDFEDPSESQGEISVKP